MGSFAPTRNPAGQSLTAAEIQIQRDQAPKVDVVALFTSTVDLIKQYPGETIGGGVAVMAGGFIVYTVIAILQAIIGVTIGLIIGNSETGGYILMGLQVMMQVIGMIVLTLVNVILMGGYNILWLRLIRGEEVSFKNFMDVKPFIVPLVVATIIMQVATMLGLLALAIPGILVALGLAMTQFMVIDKNLSIIEALKGSWALMIGHKIELLLISLIGMAVNFAGMLLCGVGLLVSVPLTLGALASFYEHIAAPGRAYAGNDDYGTAFE